MPTGSGITVGSAATVGAMAGAPDGVVAGARGGAAVGAPDGARGTVMAFTMCQPLQSSTCRTLAMDVTVGRG